jgi:glycine/D-amino acid oxidase-like deaminating enzyme
MAMAEVTVRGAGVFGLTIAFVCLSRGARVRVIDPTGAGAGASGGIVGALAPHTPDNWNPKKAFQFDCLREAEARWDQVGRLSGVDPGYARLGRLQPLANDRAEALARARVADARVNWGPDYTWEVIAAPHDWAPLSPTGLVLRDTITARINPRRACESLAECVRALGGEITTSGPDAGAVIYATGWQGLLALSETLGVDVGRGEKGQALLLDHAAPVGAPQIFADGLHIVPHGDGAIAVGSTSERHFEDPEGTDAAADALFDRAVAVMPSLANAHITARWAGVRPRAASRAPLLGPYPGKPGAFIANGGFKIGFGIAWGVADLMADLVLDGRDAIPDAFRLEACLGK